MQMPAYLLTFSSSARAGNTAAAASAARIRPTLFIVSLRDERRAFPAPSEGLEARIGTPEREPAVHDAHGFGVARASQHDQRRLDRDARSARLLPGVAHLVHAHALRVERMAS